MIRTFSLAALAAGVLALGVADANAFQRNGSWSGPRGTGSVAASGQCANATCTRSVSRTGAAGRSMNRTGSVTSIGNGGYAYSGTTTGPNGATRTRNGTFYIQR